mgnify:CR=1 FL=1
MERKNILISAKSGYPNVLKVPELTDAASGSMDGRRHNRRCFMAVVGVTLFQTMHIDTQIASTNAQRHHRG